MIITVVACWMMMKFSGAFGDVVATIVKCTSSPKSEWDAVPFIPMAMMDA